MQALRSTMLSILLTLFVGLGLASTALAHRFPTDADQTASAAMLSLKAYGFDLAAICGQGSEAPSCPDNGCPACPSGTAVAYLADAVPVQATPRFVDRLVRPQGPQLPIMWQLLAKDARGPPAGQI